MKDFASTIKKIIDSIPRYDIEKFAFKVLLGSWIAVILVVIILRAILGTRDYIQKSITEVASRAEFEPMKKSEVKKYESLLNLVKYPEEIEQYTEGLKRDPFSEYKEDRAVQLLPSTKHDFVLKSIDKIPLPMVYKGYIELPNKIIGQINWYKATRFVKAGSTIDGYRISTISKEIIEAIDEKGQRIEFELNKPIFSDELKAVLYDNISKKTFSVRDSSVIGNYKVVEITPDYVILLTEGVETKLKK